MGESNPVEVAIIGGGCAAITAAFELTRPEHQRQVPRDGLPARLAPGRQGRLRRGPGRPHRGARAARLDGLLRERLSPDARVLRRARPRSRQCPLRRLAGRVLAGAARRRGGPSRATAVAVPGGALPARAGSAGRSAQRRRSASPSATISSRTATLLRTLLVACQAAPARSQRGGDRGRRRGGPRRARRSPDGASSRRSPGCSSTACWPRRGGSIEAAAILEVMLGALPAYPENVVLALPRRHRWQCRSGSSRRSPSATTRLRRLWEVIDLVLAILRGMIRFGIAYDPRGFDAINDYECRDWLRLNGASERSLDSGFMRGLYDLRSPTRMAISAGRASGGGRRRCAARCGCSSPIAARSSGRCAPAWATSFSRRSTRC